MTRFLLFCLILIPLSGRADNLRKVMDLSGKWKFTIGDNPQWASPDYNDQSWESIYVPNAWENEGFSGYDGYAWYRITVDLHNISYNNLFLLLGYIDDVDQVFINGQMIGFSGSFPPNFYTAYNSERKYYIPHSILNKNGKNVIAIRVFDTVLDGGIIKGNIGIYTNRDEPNNTLLLEGLWKFREGSSKWWKEPEYEDDHWQTIIVPSFWRSLKSTRIEGEAWYRKSFVLPKTLINESSLVLVLGLIDDFDETYVNGVKIGETNDRLPFGASNSYRTYRIYRIPKTILKPTGENIIAVKVTDIGGNAGIYEGPLGIVPEDQFRRLIDSYRY